MNHSHPYRRRHRQDYPAASVSETNHIRSLHLNTRTIQSSMNLLRPETLVLSYSQVMMAWLLFNDDVKHVTHIGLGGGSIVRWLHYFFPKIKQCAIEINPEVIAIARSMFCLPPENEDFEIIQADGAEYIRVLYGSTDVILVDGFDGEEIIDDLVSEAFFADCYQALSANGVFVANWWSSDSRYSIYEERLQQVFGHHIIHLPAATHGNMAVLAFRQKPPRYKLDALKKQAAKLTHETDVDFVQIYRDIQRYYDCYGAF